MKTRIVLFLAFCLSAALLAGCASHVGSRMDPSFAKQVENDPFPSAAQVGLAQE